MDENVALQPHVQAAMDAFWAVIAERFAELSTGDMPPMAEKEFEDACYRAAWAWVGANAGGS